MDNSAIKEQYDVVIVGGGIAGLTSAILLARKNRKVLVIEKQDYPHHRVCGEYISNEVLPFLKSIEFDPFHFGAVPITSLHITAPNGHSIYPNLGLGGFGLSRYTLDAALSKKAVAEGAALITKCKVSSITFNGNSFNITTNTSEEFSSKIVIGSYGKRDALDNEFNREFAHKQTGYLGVKYHVKINHPANEIGLHNFQNGYCGISKVEDEKYNLCYLYQRKNGEKITTIQEVEQTVLFQNPVLKRIFSNAEFLFEKPVAINNFSFDRKSSVENHVLMCGDSAGLITPLCGNGMSMAIHAAKLLCDLIENSKVLNHHEISMNQRMKLESDYQKTWNVHFSQRLFWGRTLQSLFGNKTITNFTIRGLHAIPPLERWLIGKTHGETIEVA